MAASPKTKKASVFDKLTDSSQYTGTHKQRFDEDGKGKGIHGRKEIAPNHGYVEGFKPDSPKKTSKKEMEVIDRLTNPKLFTGTHKQRFDAETGKGKGIDGRVDRVDADGYVDGFKKAKETGKIEKSPASPAIFDRLTDPKLYTGSHKQRFDEEGKGKGKEGRTDTDAIHDLSDITRPNLRLTPNSSSNMSNSPRSARSGATTPKSPSTQNKSRPTSSTPKKDGPSIFDKLTDPKQYTGSHKQRFDEDGKGKGKAGRTDTTSADGYVQGYKEKDTYDKK